MRHVSSPLSAVLILAGLTLSTASLAADGPAVKIETVLVITSDQGKESPMTLTSWETPQGDRVDFISGGQKSVLLVPKGKDSVYLLDPRTRQARSLSRTPTSLRQYLPGIPDPRLLHGNRLAPVDFLGYRCAVREGTQVVNGSLRHVQVWEARINGRPEVLRQYSWGAGGNTELFEAVSVHVYPQTPPGLLDMPAGYAVTPLNLNGIMAQKGTP